MKTETMLVHEAMAALKVLDARIRETSNKNYFYANKHSNSKISGTPTADIVDMISRGYQSMMDMLARRRAIKHALSLSNATTKVVIAGKEYTVAEAIEMKRSGMALLEDYIGQLNHQLSSVRNICDRENSKLTAAADAYVQGMYNTKERVNTEDAQKMRDTYIAQNTYEILTCPGLEKKIPELTAEMDAFNTEVDAKLSISNAITTITIEY